MHAKEGLVDPSPLNLDVGLVEDHHTHFRATRQDQLSGSTEPIDPFSERQTEFKDVWERRHE